MTDEIKQLYEKLEACTTDEDRLEVLFAIGTGLLNFDKKRVLETAEEIKLVAERADSNLGRCYYHATRGRVFFKKALYADCEVEFKDALDMSMLTTELTTQASCLDSLGILYSFQYRYQEALEACNNALAIYEQVPGITSSRFKVVCYNNIGTAYKQMHDLEKAEENFLKGIEATAQSNDERMRYNIFNNLANLKAIQQKFDEALRYGLLSLDGFRQLKHKNGESNALIISGHCYLGKGEFAVAMNHYLTALKLLKEIDYKTVEIGALWGLGNVYMKMEAFEEAIKHYQKALSIAIAIGDDQETCDVYALLGQAYQALNQTEAAKAAFEAGIEIAVKRQLTYSLARLEKHRQLV